jgi:hypothetical protein
MGAPREIVTCNCGNQIGTKEILQTSLYLSLLGPSFVYVRFRCGRCKRVGEQLVREEKWNQGMLRPDAPSLSAEERKKFDDLGPITPAEKIDFHYALEHLEAGSLPQRRKA